MRCVMRVYRHTPLQEMWGKNIKKRALFMSAKGMYVTFYL